MQMAFYFDQSRCLGCYTCKVACKDWHDVNAGSAQWRRVTAMEWGTYPKVFLAYLSISCNHCDKPACSDACPQGAITKRQEDGIVVVDKEICLGGSDCDRYCLEACPYDAPQFGDEEDPKMQKCDCCLDRLSEGKKPICVDACPIRALDADPLDELKERYGDIKEANGFSHDKTVKPLIRFKPRYDRNP